MRTIASLLLLFIISVASSGLRVQTHFCGGALQSYALFTEAETCSGASCSNERSVSNTQSTEGIHHKKCCSNVNFQLETDDWLPTLNLDLPDNGSTGILFLSQAVLSPRVNDFSQFSKVQRGPPDLSSTPTQELLQLFLI